VSAQTITADPLLVEQIAERRAALLSRIAERTDRPVRVVCVTKGHPPVVAASAMAAGFTDLGENYAQELRSKADELSDAVTASGASWHFIGRLQTNKVRLIAPVVSLWQSVDRASLAEAVAQRAPSASVLVQLDLAGIDGRGGCRPDDAPALVGRCNELGLHVEGLMGVGPPGDPEDARAGFRLLSALADDLGLAERSMGMSGDLDVALDEGATMIRVGSSLVGPRPART
jgi:pyridoxal phosphate enzyme (YggS family)